MNLNRVFLAGNITRDPELSYTTKGTAVCKFGVAINRKWKSETGEMKEEVTFVDVDSFGRTAEAIAQYLKKGNPIFLEGRLKTDSWQDKQTSQKRSKLGVVLDSFQFVGSKNDGAQAAPRAAAPAPRAAAAATADSPVSGDSPADDQIPF